MSALSALIEVVEHLVNTHPTFNNTLSQDEALAKIAAAKADEAAHDAVHGDLNKLLDALKEAENAVAELTNPLAPVVPAIAPEAPSE